MSKTYTYPHWETSVIDYSIYTPLENEILPLHRPIFFMRTQTGPVGVPKWTPDFTRAKNIWGEGTFDDKSDFYSREAVFLQKLFVRQGAFIVRVADASAAYSSLVLELKVKNVSVPQYETDVNGQYKLDEQGNKIPKVVEGSQVSEPGVELKWQTRQLNIANGETITNLKPVTYGSGANEYRVYPILAVKAKYVGSFTNDVGVKFFMDLDNIDTTLVEQIGALAYTFGVVRKTYGQDTVSPVLSNLSNQFENVVAKPDQTDNRTERDVSFKEIIHDQYADKLPFEMNLFDENIAEVGKLIQAVEPLDTTIAEQDPFLVNLASAYNYQGVPMQHVTFSSDEDSIVLNSARILYLAGGEDGDLSDATIEALTRQYLDTTNLIYPEILDQPRYPFNFIYDTGVSIKTKKAFIGFLGVHDAFKLELSTQDVTMGRMNTKAEDLSMGSALEAACLLQPESIIKGTEAFRFEIFQHCARLTDNSYRGILPSTIDIMDKRSSHQSTPAITGQIGGRPNSEIHMLTDWNWAASDADHKQKSWDTGLNYFQYYDMENIHWPAIRTGYRYDTSVLSNSTFTDVVVYIKHIVREAWSIYAGVEWDFATVASRATSTLTGMLKAMLNGMFNFSVEFSQSEEEAKIGYISHCTIKLYGNPQQRVWKIDIECYRNGYDPTAQE